MDKLISKFCSFTFEYRNEGVQLLACAEETKKIAIEFAKWLHRTNWYEDKELDNSDKLFDKFIEEYYV